MPDNITPLTTEHLRIMREDIQRIHDDMKTFRADITKEVKQGFAEIKQRYRVQEHQIMGLKRDEVSAAEDVTALRHQIDAMIERLHRLEDHAAH